MFEKLFEDTFKDSIIRGYRSRSEFGIYDLIDRIQAVGLKIADIYIDEDADLGLKSFEGSYLLESFLKKYPKINKEDISSIHVHLENEISISVSNNHWICMSSKYDIELTELLGMANGERLPDV